MGNTVILYVLIYQEKQILEVGSVLVLDRVTQTSARGAEGPERIEDAADTGGRTDHVPDAGQAAGQRQRPGGAHT